MTSGSRSCAGLNLDAAIESGALAALRHSSSKVPATWIDPRTPYIAVLGTLGGAFPLTPVNPLTLTGSLMEGP